TPKRPDRGARKRPIPESSPSLIAPKREKSRREIKHGIYASASKYDRKKKINEHNLLKEYIRHKANKKVINAEKIIIKCESCGQKLRVPVLDKEIEVKCPKCNFKFTVKPA
ncbi:MAG: hypothetical protein AB1814_18160, partial [Thermodesulfobacteriota bacterium]